MEHAPEDRLDLHRHPKARLPILVFRAMGSASNQEMTVPATRKQKKER
jgi:hypothetical protein